MVLFRFRLPPFFSSLASLALSGFARFGPGVLALVFSPSLFFCVPLLVSRLSNSSSHLHFHLIFIPFSSLSSYHSSGPELSHPASAGCVCVKHLNRCKTSVGRGTQHFTGTVSNEATSEMGYPAWPAGRTCNPIIYVICTFADMAWG